MPLGLGLGLANQSSGRAILAPPQNLVQSSASLTDVTLQWDAVPGADFYEWSTDAGSTTNNNGLVDSVTVATGSCIDFWVRAHSPILEYSGWATINACPSTPTLPAADPVTGQAMADSGGNTLTVTWTDPAVVPDVIEIILWCNEDAAGVDYGYIGYGVGYCQFTNNIASGKTYVAYLTNRGDGVNYSNSTTATTNTVTMP